MHFDLTHRYGAPPAEVAAAYADPDLYPALAGLPKLGGAEVLAHERDGDRARLRIRYRFTGHLSGAVTAVVDPARLTWVEESSHDLGALAVTWRMVPDHYADRLQARGTYRFEADPRDAGRTVRRTSGELKVRAPLVAGRVEQAIVSGLGEHLDAEVPAVEGFLRAR